MRPKKALKRDLKAFRAKISNRLAEGIAGWFAVVGCLVFLVCWIAEIQHSSQSKEDALLVGFFSGIVAAFLPTVIAYTIGSVVGERIVGRIWKKQIGEERERLLEKYPAAKAVGH